MPNLNTSIVKREKVKKENLKEVKKEKDNGKETKQDNGNRERRRGE